MATERLCQICGRPATFSVKPPKKYKGVKTLRHYRGRNDHDLCGMCFYNAMERIRATELGEREREVKASFRGANYILSDSELESFASAIVAILNIDH